MKVLEYHNKGEFFMNFVFLSPNFPKTYFNFTDRLKKIGFNTLGIGEEPYEMLSEGCRNSLTEYYKVNSMENYDEVYRACAYFAFKYGKLDWLETNNEYWLIRDAHLRDDFNINTGLKTDRIDGIKYKSAMKKYYHEANVPVARYHLVTNYDEGKAFLDEVGYPVVVKPDNGVGAYATYKVSNDEELKNFYNTKPDVTYIMEEFIEGTIVTYDGICNSKRDIVFETSHFFPDNVMDSVNKQLDMVYYSKREIPEDLKEMGRRVIKAFASNSRFFHLEFFRLTKAKRA